MKHTLFQLTFLLVVMSASGQSRIGYIVYDSVWRSFSLYNLELEKIELTAQQFEDTFKTLLKDYDSFLKQAIPHNEKLDSAEIIALEDSLMQLQNRIEIYAQNAQFKILSDKEAIKARTNLLIKKELEGFCKENEMDCIADKNSVLYCSDCRDFTKDFVDYLNRIYPVR